MKRFAILVAVILPGPAGCKDERLPPPREAQSRLGDSEVDLDHAALIRADRTITVTNLKLVVQTDPSDPTAMGVSLVSTAPGRDEPRLIFGTFARAASIDQLAQTEMHFAGPSVMNPRGSGIFTSLYAYQPKLAALRITGHSENEVRGTLQGEFYRFRMMTPAFRPHVAKLEATFVAELIVR